MKFVILAAGKGSRLYPLVEDTPKSLLDLGNGVTLLERQLNTATSCDQIKKVLIATGFKHQKIINFLQTYQTTKEIHVEYNPFFELADNFVTLWTIRHLLKGNDLIISNGDNLYKEHVIKYVTDQIQDQEGIFITVNRKNHYDTDDMKVLLNINNNILKIHKQIDTSLAMAESVGLAIIKGNKAHQTFLEAMEDVSKKEECFTCYWLEIFNHLIQNGHPVKSIFIDHADWRELDFHPDVNLIRKSILENLF